MKLSLSVILILLLSLICFSQQKINSDYEVYRDEKYPFSLFYPKGWTQLQPSHAQTRFKVAKEDGIYLTDFNINAVYSDAAKNLAPESLVKMLANDSKLVDTLIKQGNPTSKLISSGKTYISNQEAFYIKSEATYRVFDEKHEMTVYQIMTFKSGVTYTLTFRSLTNEFNDNFPIFKAIASSFVIRPTQVLAPKTKISGQTPNITFEKVNLDGIGSISIPSNMELQAGTYKQLSDQTSKALGFDVSGQIIFQQKGRNDILKQSESYARIIIARIQGKSGEFSKITSKLALTTQELKVVDNQLKTEMENSFKESKINLKLLRWDGTSIANVNGRNALKMAYLRQLETNSPVYVEIYLIQNYDVMYRLTISYRLEDGQQWKNVLEKAKDSFTVTNIR